MNNKTNSKIYFLTYGDDKFLKSRFRIIKEAKSLNIFDECICYTRDNIENDLRDVLNKNIEFKNVFNGKRGGGYFIWRPYIFYKLLNLINNNDIIIYADAGCTINNNIEVIDNLKKYINILHDSKSGILGFRNPNIESIWTKSDIFNYFGVLNNEVITNTRQFCTNRMMIKKNENSLNIFSKYWDIALNNPHFFDDSESIIPNFSNFIENRHCQSVLSSLYKLSYIEDDYDWEKINITIQLTRIRE